GVALVAAVRLANHAVLRAFVEVIDTMAGRAALEVVAGEGGLFPEDVAAAVGATPGVEVAVPCVKGAAFAEGGALLTVYGVDLTGDATERVYGARLEVDDPQAFLARPDSIAVARPFAAARGLRPGDHLELTTPAGRRAFTVRGLLDADGVARAYAGNVAAMDLHAAEQLFTRRGFITGVDVVVAPEADVRRVAEALARRLPAGLRVGATAERHPSRYRPRASPRAGDRHRRRGRRQAGHTTGRARGGARPAAPRGRARARHRRPRRRAAGVARGARRRRRDHAQPRPRGARGE